MLQYKCSVSSKWFKAGGNLMAVTTEGEAGGSLQAALSQRPRTFGFQKTNKAGVDQKRICHTNLPVQSGHCSLTSSGTVERQLHLILF